MACGPTQTNITQTTIPCYAAPYVEQMLGQAAAYTCTTQNPYLQYQGCTIAQFTPLQQQAFQNAALMQGSPQLKCATALAGEAGLGGINTGYTYNPYSAQQALGTNAATGKSNVSSYMNPYLQCALAPQLALMRQQQGQQQAQNQAQAVGYGAFGGARCAVLTGAQNQANQLAQANLVGNAYNTAYCNAQKAFTAQQAACQAAANLNAQQGQFGANLGLQGLNLANQSANTLGTLGNNQYNQNLGITGLQAQLGGTQQQQTQNVLNQQYQCFMNAQNYQGNQLNYMSNLLRGLPMTNTTSNIYSAPPSMLSQVAGVGLTAAGLGAFKAAKGGPIKEKKRKSNGLADLALSKMGA